MTITLTPEQEQIIQAELATGEYRDAQEVVVAAIRSFGERSQFAAFQAHIKEGLDQIDRGEFAETDILGIIAERNAERMSR